MSQRGDHSTLSAVSGMPPNTTSVSAGVGGIFIDDPARCVRKLESHLRLNPATVNQFTDDLFRHLMSEEMLLMRMMNPLESSSRNSVDQSSISGHFGHFDSFLKLLLRVETIQTSVIGSLLQVMIAKLNGAVADEGSFAISMKIFNHIRWCDVIFRPADVIRTILEAIPNFPREMKIESISTLPSLIYDHGRDALVIELLEMLDTCPDLIACIFDTISNLNLPVHSDALILATDKAVELMSSAGHNDLPMLTRFLLDATTTTNAIDILSQLRNKLSDFINSGSHLMESHATYEYDVWRSQSLLLAQNRRGQMTFANEIAQHFSCITLILNIIKTCFYSKQLVLMGAFTQIVQSESDFESMEVIDLWIAYCLYGSSKLRSKMHTLLTRKYVNGSLTFKLFLRSIKGYRSVLDNYLFVSICAIAQNLIAMSAFQGRIVAGSMTSVTSITEKSIGIDGLATDYPQMMALELYLILYAEWAKSAQRRQEIVAALVSHVSSPNLAEANSGLLILAAISECEDIAVSLNGDRESSPVSSSASQGIGTEIDEMNQGYNSNPLNSVILRSICKDICNVLYLSTVRIRQPINSIASGSTTLGTFAPFIKSLLDDVRSFTDYQLRVLFRIVFQSSVPKHILCDSIRSSNEIGNSIEENLPFATGSMVATQVQDSLPNDVMILLKKFLSSNDFKVRKIAIIAFVSFLTLIRTSQFEEVDPDETNDPEMEPTEQSHSISAGLANYLLNNLLCSLTNDSQGLAFLNDEFADVISSGMLNSTVIIERLFRSSDESLQELIGFSLEDIPPINAYWTTLLLRKGNRPVINNSKNTLSSINASNCSNISLSFGLTRQQTPITGSNLRTNSTHPATRVSTQRGLTQLGTVGTGGAVDDDSLIFFRILSGVLKSEYTQPFSLQNPSASSSSSSSSSSTLVLAAENNENSGICLESVNCRGDSISSLTAVIRLLSACNLRISNSLAAIGVIITCPLELPSNSVFDNYEEYFHPTVTPGIDGRVPHIICYSVKYSVDILREVIGAFSRIVQDSDDKAGIVHRFNCLVEAEGILISLLQRSKEDVVEEFTGSNYSSIGSYNPTVSKKNTSTKVIVAKTRSVSTKGRKGTSLKKKGKDNLLESIYEDEELETHGSEDEMLIPISEIGVQIGRTSALSRNETLTDLKLIVTQIELAIEPNLRPLALSAGSILGFGINACSLPVGMVTAGMTTSSRSEAVLLDDNITLSDRSILRLLLHILSSCKIFERKSSSSGSRATLVLTNDLMLSPSPIAVSKCQLELPACCNVRVDTGEMEFYSHLQKYESFLALFDFMDIFSVCLSKSLDNENIESSSENTIKPYNELRRSGHLTQSRIGQSTRAASSGSHVEPIDQISRMMLVMNIMLSVLNSKLLIDNFISSVSLLLSQQDEMGRIRSSQRSIIIHRPLLVSILANFAGNMLSDANESDIEQTGSSSDFIKEFESSVFMLYENLNIICCRLKEPMLLDIAVTAVRIIDRCLVLLDKVKSIIELSGDQLNNYISLRNQSRSEIAAGICTICVNIISQDWTDSFTKRRYTSKDLGYMLETQFKYLPHENRLVMISEFATSVIPGIINDSENDQTSEGAGSNTGGLYATANKSTMVLYYSSVMKNVTDLWTTCINDYRHHMEVNGGKDYEADGSTEEALIETLRSLVESFKNLVLLSKINDVQKSLYVTTLRDGGKFVRKFVESMNILTRLTSSEIFRSLVLKILGRLQLATRQLQHLCAHAKSVLRDNQLSKEVPAIKKLLEELIFRARDMASKIPFLQDIRISTLKHRRIDGTAMRKEDIEDEILSQAVYSPEDSASDDGRRPGAKHKRNSQGLRPSATPSKSLNRERHSSSSRDKERTQIPVAKNKSRNKRSLNHSIAANSDTEDKEIIRIEENNVPKLLAESDEEGEVEYLDGNNEENEIGYSGSESVSDDSDHIPVSERPHQKIKISDRKLAGTSIQRNSSKTSKRGKQFVISDDEDEDDNEDKDDYGARKANQGKLDVFEDIESPILLKEFQKRNKPTFKRGKVEDEAEMELEFLGENLGNDNDEYSGKEDNYSEDSEDDGDDCLDSYGSEVVSDNAEIEFDHSDAGYPFDGDSNSD